jgi:hypothetical protein
MAKPDPFMAMLDCAWDDFKTYDDPDEPSTPLGLVVILIGNDAEGMTVKTGANIHPEWVKAALAQVTLGLVTGTMAMECMPKIRRKRVV